MSSEEELRLQNRSLISQLLERQRTAQFATSSATSLSRQLDSLQSKLDKLNVSRNEPLVLNNSDSITRANTNNNNLTNVRWDSRMLDMADKSQSDDIFRTSDRSRSPAFVHKGSKFSPPTRDILTTRTHTSDVTSLRARVSYDSSLTENLSPGAPVRAPASDDTSPTVEGEVWITRGSPEDSRSVRRRLAEEMSPKNSPPTLEARSAFRGSTNADPRTPQKPWARSLRGTTTPKTILKHRKMIDSNVRVDSKFAHTPGWMDRAKHTRLKPKSPAKTRHSTKKKDKKNISASRKLPSFNKTEIDDLKGVSFLDEQPAHQAELPARFGNPDILVGDVGNMRSTTLNRSPRGSQSVIEQGVLDTPDAVRRSPRTPNNSFRDNLPTPQSLTNLGPTPPSSAKHPHIGDDSRDSSSSSAQYKRSREQQRMMGYDWIAALLDQSNSVVERVTGRGDDHEKYFSELREFRRVHRDECQNDAVSLPSGYGHLSLVDTEDISQPTQAPASPNHTCIHSYSVNPRLYAEPVNSDRTGASRCAVCNKKKQLPSATSPAFVRVSIPRCTLSSPYKVKPHRRKSFDPSDSVALSKHCLAGWVHQRPMKLPLVRNIDLANETNRLKSKFTMTMAEAEDLAKKSVPLHSRDLDQTTLYNREVRRITDELLDMSHAMQFQTQLLNKTPIH